MVSWEHMLVCPQVNKLSVPAFSSAVPFLQRIASKTKCPRVPQNNWGLFFFFPLHHEAATLPLLTCHASYHNQGSNSIPLSSSTKQYLEAAEGRQGKIVIV